MASTGKMWAIGCGSGCLLVLIILGGFGTCSYFGIKEIVDSADDLEASLAELDVRFGPAETYVPAADGTIDASQIVIFLTAREDLLERAGETTDILVTLDGDGGALAKIRAGMKLIPSLLAFIGQRGAVLLENDLHPGEYAYLYSLAYFVWLGHDPGDGPGFEIDGNNEHEGFQWETSDGGDVHAERAISARRDLNRLLTALLANQQEAWQLTGRDDPEWTAMLDAELAAMQDDPYRLAWQDGLPDRMVDALAPYRDRLEAVYSDPLNGLEMSILSDD